MNEPVIVGVGPAVRRRAGAAGVVRPAEARDREEAAQIVGEREAGVVIVGTRQLQRGLAGAEWIVGDRDSRRPVAERLDLNLLTRVGIDPRLGGVFALRRQQVRPDDVGRDAAAQVLRVLPVVADTRIDTPPAAAERVLDVAVIGPPVVVPQLIAPQFGAVGHEAGQS